MFIMHLSSVFVFCVCPPPHPYAPLCAIYLEGYRYGGILVRSYLLVRYCSFLLLRTLITLTLRYQLRQNGTIDL